MATVKQEVISMVSTFPETVSLDEIIEQLNRLRQQEVSRNHVYELTSNHSQTLSCFDVMKEYIGSFEGPEDLATNPKYMEGYGQ